METCCSICGDLLSSEYSHKQPCGHEFHYQCLLLTFKNMKNTECPYCRVSNKLPVVSGLKKKIHWIHEDTDEQPLVKCQQLLTKGKNKGHKCTRGCQLGYEYCKIHLQQKKKTNNS
tara:strand:- start:120 stop:467 length:348 start_codon:yes stop_codon:yes gene_type:complete